MSRLELLLLVCAGLGGGLAGSIAGMASLVSYPALLAVGLGPVTANVTNTVALVFSSLGATLGSRTELEGQALRVRELAVAAVLGGGAGAALLLLTPSGTFELIAPWLIGVSSLTILLRPRVPAIQPPGGEHRGAGAGLVAGVFLIGIYGGYFGAAAGVMLLALLLAGTDETLARTNALKNVVLGMANAIAAVGFSLLGPVHWAAVAPLAAGLFAGARLGPIVVRHSNAAVLRAVIGVAGLALAVKLGIDAY
ncbi:MAG: sulfite exporter TauE/SafE family protein [Solirubrobacteraceae bacterium]